MYFAPGESSSLRHWSEGFEYNITYFYSQMGITLQYLLNKFFTTGPNTITLLQALVTYRFVSAASNVNKLNF